MKFFLNLLKCFALFCFAASGVHAQANDPVPDALMPWADWVQRDQIADPCIDQSGRKHCYFANAAAIDLAADQARFEVEIHARTRVALELPGADSLWPQDVLLNGEAAPVLTNLEGVPYLILEPGDHSIRGVIPWTQEPRTIPLPPSFALVSVTEQGMPTQARLSRDGALLLDAAEVREATVADRIDLEVFRLVRDGVPLRVETRLRLKVSGQQRVEQIDGALLEGFEPLSFASDLTGRVDQNGTIILQVRPGEWTVTLNSIRTEQNDTFPLRALDAPWPESEIWVLLQDPRLRQLTLTGGQTIDPSQTELPNDWREWAAYRVDTNSTVELVTATERQVDAPDRLELTRRARLNFDGSGFELRDTISGTVRQSTRLDTSDSLQLGSARIAGVPQIVTLNAETGQSGLQIQQGNLQVSAESRISSGASTYLMNGWQHEFDDVRTVIELPPGYRLVTALGVDSTQGAWLDQWALLDIFLVILVAVAAARVYGLWIGLISLAGMVLTHLFFPSFAIYFLILIGLATLYALVPDGWIKSSFRLFKYGAILLVFLEVTPFSLAQAKEALFPQLSAEFSVPRATGNVAEPITGRASRVESMSLNSQLGDYSASIDDSLLRQQAVLNQKGAENVIAQTGFGLSAWEGREVRLIWHGEVPADLSAQLILVGPNANLVIGFLKALFPLLMLVIVLVKAANISGGWRAAKSKGGAAGQVAASLLFVAMIGGGLWASPVSAQAQTQTQTPLGGQATPPRQNDESFAGFPPAHLLEQLRAYYAEQRAQSEIPCAPLCSEIARLQITLSANQFSYDMEVHAAKPSLVALPITVETWRPDGLTLEGATTEPQYLRLGRFVHLLVQPGITRVTAQGTPPARDRFDAEFSQMPRQIQITTEGWTDYGLSEDGSLQGKLQFIRDQSGQDEGEQTGLTGPSDISPFFNLSRLVTLDYSWTVVNNIRLLSPAGQAVQLRVPLLDGEAVTSDGVRTEGRFAIVNIAPGATEVSWLSVLAEAPTLRLEAPQNRPWTEDWVVVANNTWDLSFNGPSALREDTPDASRTFRPWPGEVLEIEISKPASAGGQTKTITRVDNEVRQGLRSIQGELTLNLSSSTAGEHIFSFPPDARIVAFSMNDVRQTILFADGDLTASFAPGQHNVQINWEVPSSLSYILTSPSVDLNFPAANVTTRFTVPQSRWVLWSQGEGAGPAILFWSTVPIWLLLAIGVAKLPFATLRWWEFFLLFLGLTQSSYYFSLVVVGFILAVHLSGSRDHFQKHPILFNLRQVSLVLWAVVATVCLLTAIYWGFDDRPVMMVEGQGSSTRTYAWYMDQIEAILPQAEIYTLPLWAYRGVMLLWALWLAVRIIRWLPIGWSDFSRWGILRPVSFSKPKEESPKDA